MAEVELQTGLEELLQLCQQQHETLTAALQRNFRQVSQGSCGSIRSTMSCQIAADLRTKKPELAMELVDEAPPLLDLEVLSNHSSPGAKGRENSRGAKDFDYTEHSFAVSEWSVSPADTTIKAVSHSRSNLIECSFGVNPLDGLTGWRYWRELTKMRIDYIAGVLVLLNSMMMIFELEIEGHHSGAMLGISEDLGFHSMERSFRFIDLTFVWIYLLELLVRLVVEWPCFHRSCANWFDVFLVLAGLADIYIIAPLANGGSAARNIAMLRLFRATKSFRSMRMVRTFRLFHGLRLLVKACQSFLPSLAWSMVLLGVFMSMGALIMGNLLQVFYLEASYPQEDRELIWNYYGTAYRSFWTLYEITFAGNWPTRARPVMEKVSQLFVVFFFCYVTVIVFAVLRVISAVFLKDTLDAAHNDEENMMAISQHQKKEYIERLEKVFRTLDEFGDGMITQPRLEQLLAEPKVQAYFKTLDVDVTETSALFHLLDDGDGEVTLDEFIDGILRCKGPARAIDQVAMHSDIKQLDKKLSKVMKAMRATSKPQKKAHLEEENMTCAHSHAEHLKVFRMGLLEGDHSFFERQKSPV